MNSRILQYHTLILIVFVNGDIIDEKLLNVFSPLGFAGTEKSYFETYVGMIYSIYHGGFVLRIRLYFVFFIQKNE